MVVAILKFTALAASLFLLRRVICYKKMKINSRLAYASHMVLFAVVLI